MLKFWNKLNLTYPEHFQIIDFFEMMPNKTKRNFTIYLLLIQNITKSLVHYQSLPDTDMGSDTSESVSQSLGFFERFISPLISAHILSFAVHLMDLGSKFLITDRGDLVGTIRSILSLS